MIISFRQCSVPVSSLYLYFASPNWSSLSAITDAPPTLAVACAPPLRLIAYASLAFLYHFGFFACVRKGLGVDALLVAKPHCALFVSILVVHAFTCAARWRSPCLRRRSVRLSRAPLGGGRRVCAAEACVFHVRRSVAVAVSAPPKRASFMRRQSVRGCAAEAALHLG